jgi:hypothetical protein
MNQETEINYENLSEFDLFSIIKFIKDYFIQLLLLILVFVIIYIVDHISNINTIIFSTPSVLPTIIHPKRRKTLKK